MVRKANTKVRKARVKKDKESSLVFNCTSCAQPQLLVQGKRNILCHPQLQVGVCRECLIFAHADVIPLDEEGYEIYCRWCSELGNLVCCDECKSPFCEECISRNIGPEYYNSLLDVDEWKCFICEPAAIESLRELAKAALDHQNYNDPSDLLLEKCSAIFNGDADLNDSDREEIVKERLRLRRNNLNETFNRKKKEKDAEAKENSESDSGKSDKMVSESDEVDELTKEKKKNADSGSEYESSPESPKKEEDSVASDGSEEESLPSVEVSDKNSAKRKQSSDNDSEASNETLDLDKDSKKRVKSKKSKKTEDSDISDSDSELMEEKRKSRKSKAKSYNLSLKNQRKSNLRNPVKKPKYASSEEKSESSD